jgi:hypothetical protein
MGNSFNKIDKEINYEDSIDTLNWNSTIKEDTVDTLGWNSTVESLGWNKNKIDTDSATSSPFVSTEVYKKMMEGGDKKQTFDDSSSSSDSNSETSSTDTDKLSEILSLSDYKKDDKKKNQTGSSIEAYGFSNTSSSISQKFKINSNTSTINSSFSPKSSSINTSDINLVSIDKNSSEINHVSANSVNGKRFL